MHEDVAQATRATSAPGDGARGGTVTVGIPTYNRAHWLRESVGSVLAQTHEDFRLLVCDNASDDDTQEVVASFSDPRIRYERSERNVGMIANFNRVIELADTDAVVLLPDDDVLYPDYLSNVLDVLHSHPSVGLVHTAFDLIGTDSRVLEKARMLVQPRSGVTVEGGDRYLKRSMESTWTVCWPSALFRRVALIEAGGLRAAEEPLADVPLLMRVALRWDLAFVSDPLVAFRMHANSATSDLGAFTGTGYDLAELPEILYAHRVRFLDRAETLDEGQASAYRRIATATFRRDAVRRLAARASLGLGWWTTNADLLSLVRDDPRVLLVPDTWRLVAAQLGGRYIRRALGRS